MYLKLGKGEGNNEAIQTHFFNEFLMFILRKKTFLKL